MLLQLQDTVHASIVTSDLLGICYSACCSWTLVVADVGHFNTATLPLSASISNWVITRIQPMLITQSVRPQAERVRSRVGVADEDRSQAHGYTSADLFFLRRECSALYSRNKRSRTHNSILLLFA